MKERVVENLNRALREAMSADEGVVLIGEDIADPYGGAFKVTRGLQSEFPEQVVATPISELGFTGFANGLALAGQKPIVEYMFGDFVFLAIDQIANFAAKSIEMYGSRQQHSIVFRCPVGGHRGYGATHSQSVQKHFLGIPGLDLFEISPLHDAGVFLPRLLGSGRASVLFEEKVLYGSPCLEPGEIDDIFIFDFIDAEQSVARVRADEGADVLILCPGGQFNNCHRAALNLFRESDIECEIRVPFQIFPFPSELLSESDSDFRQIVTVEESTPGGTWGAEIASRVAEACPQTPFLSITAANSPIPSARHLEDKVLPGPNLIESKIGAAYK